MPRSILSRIKAAVRAGGYDITVHGMEEMAEDDLDVDDVEAALLSGVLAKTRTDDPRGTRYTVVGPGADGATQVGVVGRFTETGRYLIITVYQVI